MQQVSAAAQCLARAMSYFGNNDMLHCIFYRLAERAIPRASSPHARRG